MKNYLYWQICIIVAHCIALLPMYLTYKRNKKVNDIMTKMREINIAKALNEINNKKNYF
jgi:hypothetical protein